MLLSHNRYEMRRSSVATSDGQMDHGQVRKPRISRQKPVTWPDTAFGHLTRPTYRPTRIALQMAKNGPWPGEKTPYFTAKTGHMARHGIWPSDRICLRWADWVGWPRRVTTWRADWVEP